jgi:hypothetical protein
VRPVPLHIVTSPRYIVSSVLALDSRCSFLDHHLLSLIDIPQLSSSLLNYLIVLLNQAFPFIAAALICLSSSPVTRFFSPSSLGPLLFIFPAQLVISSRSYGLATASGDSLHPGSTTLCLKLVRKPLCPIHLGR